MCASASSKRFRQRRMQIERREPRGPRKSHSTATTFLRLLKRKAGRLRSAPHSSIEIGGRHTKSSRIPNHCSIRSSYGRERNTLTWPNSRRWWPVRKASRFAASTSGKVTTPPEKWLENIIGTELGGEG